MPAAPSSLIENARIKLGRLKEQIDAVASSEHPNADSRLAVQDLGGQTDRVLRRLGNFEQYPDQLQRSLLRQANHVIFNVTELLGFLVRSTSTRNLFELYYPFLELSKKLIENDVHLILSSDWQFSPFTYPYGLDLLPNYILIGLPASESENALLFPTAAHELGHNIWKARSFADQIRSDVEDKVYSAIDADRLEFDRIFGTQKADIRNDMFVQPAIRPSIRFAMRQLEELFCDYSGLVIFGHSYLYAFDYLLAPILGGVRNGEYPSSRDRVLYMIKHAATISIDLNGMEARFYDESLTGVEEIDYQIKIADRAVEAIENFVFDKCKEYVHGKVGDPLDSQKSLQILSRFESGVPISHVASLGDILNAAWMMYNQTPDKGFIDSKGVELVPFITDLVIKSSESLEYRSFINRA